MPYIVVVNEHETQCSKGLLKREQVLYVPPSKYKVTEHELASLTHKQLAEAAEAYPKEYDAELGYIGKGADKEE